MSADVLYIKAKKFEADNRYAYVCGCGGWDFILTTPNEITCNTCGFTLPDMFWYISDDEDIIITREEEDGNTSD